MNNYFKDHGICNGDNQLKFKLVDLCSLGVDNEYLMP